ncbi:MAG: YdcF family protein [Cyanobacteria bacterium J06554_11]
MESKRAIARALSRRGIFYQKRTHLQRRNSGYRLTRQPASPSARQSGRQHKSRGLMSFVISIFLLLLTAITLGSAYIRYQQQFLNPSVALVLGGAPEREVFAAQFAKTHPAVEIWVSSGSNPEYAQWVFDEAHIPVEQWHLDYQAVDTVTNFTTLVDELEARGIHEVYLLTSDYHMRRASVIAQIVLGSRGIGFKPVAIPTERHPDRPETLMREVRDGARSLLWVVTGKTGSEWRNALKGKS